MKKLQTEWQFATPSISLNWSNTERKWQIYGHIQDSIYIKGVGLWQFSITHAVQRFISHYDYLVSSVWQSVWQSAWPSPSARVSFSFPTVLSGMSLCQPFDQFSLPHSCLSFKHSAAYYFRWVTTQRTHRWDSWPGFLLGSITLCFFSQF